MLCMFREVDACSRTCGICAYIHPGACGPVISWAFHASRFACRVDMPRVSQQVDVPARGKDGIMSRLRWRLALALIMGSGLLPCFAAAPPAQESAVEAWISQRIRDWQPTRQERRFDEIGWAKDIRTALALARQHQRPVFLFTYDGTDLATYRC